MNNELLPCPFKDCHGTMEYHEDDYNNGYLCPECEGWVMPCLKHLEAHADKAVPDGWRLVPIEPTDEMAEDADWDFHDEWSKQRESSMKKYNCLALSSEGFSRRIYKAMLSAAPQPPIQTTEWQPIESAQEQIDALYGTIESQKQTHDALIKMNKELLWALNSLLCVGYHSRSEYGGDECFYCGGDFSNLKGDFKHTKDCSAIIAEKAIANAGKRE